METHHRHQGSDHPTASQPGAGDSEPGQYAFLNYVSANIVGGNGNKLVDPNECNELEVIIRNDGNSRATQYFFYPG